MAWGRASMSAAELFNEVTTNTGAGACPVPSAAVWVPYIFDKYAQENLENLVSLEPDAFTAIYDEAIATIAEKDKPPPAMRIVTLGWFIKAKKLLEGGGKPPPPAPTSSKMGPPVAEMPEAPAAPTELKVYPKGDIAKMLMADMKKTGMDQACITALDRTIHSGQLVDPSECEGAQYAVDTALSDFGRKMIKHEAETLTKLLKAKDYLGTKAHFTSIIRQYNEKGWIAEGTNVNSFVTMTDEIFANDQEGYLRYVTAFRQKYKGRAFVEEVDLVLVIKNAFATRPTVALAGLKDELKDLKSQVSKIPTSGGSNAGDLSALKSKVQTLENRVRVLESNGSSSGTGGRPTPPCGICGEVGHFARDCPNKPKRDDKNKDDKDKDKGSSSKDE